MDSEMFETCMEELAAALHGELLVGNGAANFLNIAITVLNRYRMEAVGLDELEIIEETMNDATRRIQFGFSNPVADPVRRHLFLRDQLTYAFTATEERRKLLGCDTLNRNLFVIEEE